MLESQQDFEDRKVLLHKQLQDAYVERDEVLKRGRRVKYQREQYYKQIDNDCREKLNARFERLENSSSLAEVIWSS